MSSIQFGAFTEEAFITLVRSRFQALDVMDAGSPQRNFLSDALDSDVEDMPSDYDPAPSPSALAAWEAMEAADAMIVDPVDPPRVPAADAEHNPVQTLAPPLPAAVDWDAVVEKDEQRGVDEYLRTLTKDKAVTFDGVHDSDRKCLLCNTDSHSLVKCPKRKEAFEQKKFYAYDRPNKKA